MQVVSTEKKEQSADEKVLELARTRFARGVESDSEFRSKFVEDLRFFDGDQWPEEVKRIRDADGRPCHVINRTEAPVNHLINEQRQNTPAIKVSPVDDKADPETAKIFQGLIRHIEVTSGAKNAYINALKPAAIGGRGFFRLTTQYCDQMSFDQEVVFKPIYNALACVIDDESEEIDGSDMNWAFIPDYMQEDEYKAKYPNSKLGQESKWDEFDSSNGDWIKKGQCRVTEYFERIFEDKEICLLDDGTVILASQSKGIDASRILKKRFARVPKIIWRKINGIEVLETTEWLGKWIPIVPVYGNVLNIEGKRKISGIVKNARDPQIALNYMKSAQSETIALAPRAPFIGAEGQFEGHEDKWAASNRKNFAFLQYKPVNEAGQPLPPPQRNAYEPPIQAISMTSMQASDDLKATTGYFDSALGNAANEVSGIAIQRRTQQSQTGNFHYIDNLNESIRHAGRILVDLIPKIYDTERAVRIIGEDDQDDVVIINQILEDGKKQNHLGFGKYDVTTDVGPSYATKRQEAVDSMLDFLGKNPNAAPYVQDLMVANMDWPGAKEIAERLKKTLPPGFADDGKQKDIPPEAQAQLAQQGQLIEQLTGQLKELTSEVETKKMELESRERIEFAKIQRDIEIKLAELGQEGSIEMLRQEIAQIESRMKMVGMLEPIDEDFNGDGTAGAMSPNEQQPTGGIPPGTSIGENYVDQS